MKTKPSEVEQHWVSVFQPDGLPGWVYMGQSFSCTEGKQLKKASRRHEGGITLGITTVS